MKRKKEIMAALFLLAVLLVFTGCSDKGSLDSDAENAEKEPGDEVISSGFEEVEEVVMEQDDQENPDGEKPDQAENEDEKLFISASVLNVRSDAGTTGSIVGKIIKGSQVSVIETVFDEDGSPIWHKISYEHEDGDYGWVSADYTVKDKMEFLGPGYADIDFSPQEKPENYENNPRVTVNGIYLTGYSAGSAKLDKMIDLADRSKINAFVINMKDDNGTMLFKTDIAEEMNPEAGVIYKDSGAPFYFKKNIQWSSAYNRELWKYVVGVAKEAAEAGFNEIQFDYVRFPTSNGGKRDAYLDYRNELGESKPLAVQNFLKYAREELDPYEVYISADVFGLVGSVGDDMGIGQYWEAISNVVDYISPMMYPSHYGPGVYGLSVPDAFPYETIYRCTNDSIMKNMNIETPAIVRPWIQDFTATYVDGPIRYGAEQIRAQIKGLNDNGVEGFMLWNPSNNYDEGGVEKE